MPVFVAIWSFITSLPAWLLTVLTVFAASLTDLGKDLLVWFFAQAMDLIVFVLSSIPVPASTFDASAFWAMLPAPIIQTFSYLGGVEALAVVVSALGIRLLLGLIPFVRIGG